VFLLCVRLVLVEQVEVGESPSGSGVWVTLTPMDPPEITSTDFPGALQGLEIACADITLQGGIAGGGRRGGGGGFSVI
jgi:hypothetical protein